MTPNDASLKRDLIRIDVARRVVRRGDVVVGSGAAAGRHTSAACATAAAACSPRFEELHVVGDDLGHPPLLPVLAFPRPGLNAPLDKDERALARVLGDGLCEVSLADRVGDDVVVVGELLALTVRT